MELYEITKIILGLLPIIFIFIVFIVVKNFIWSYRYPIVMISGWIVIFFSALAMQEYSIYYAPTEKIAEEVANSDGAAVAFSYLFGWVYALVLMFIMDVSHKAYLYFLRKVFSSKKSYNQ
ncbi:hypothetical protein YH65_05990 [Sulfurovum lithotrophicum]|uniref:Uncharacterized protein n=1 Tax=Sulfurovum lithotrophicum TaxID=206403 RepID=A0A7U4M1A9_9BACT|nr:hypothetical protein [Sulfurovum lithotrophicum]AKF24992.1 hypothetical protein YH65_05990 [Sulfurovum lithotrophicum]